MDYDNTTLLHNITSRDFLYFAENVIFKKFHIMLKMNSLYSDVSPTMTLLQRIKCSFCVKKLIPQCKSLWDMALINMIQTM